MRMKWLEESECWVTSEGDIYRTTKTGIEKCNQRLGKNGYYSVSIKSRMYYVHRLLATAFIPNPDCRPSVDHINRVRTDNRLENLRWATWHEQSENSGNVLDRADYGVRFIEDPNQYKYNWAKAHPESRRLSLKRYAEKKRLEQQCQMNSQ